MSDHLVHAYQSMPVSFTRGDGCYLWDSDGKQYLDALCGISVTSLGHNLPALTAAIQEQAATLLHTSNLYSITWQHKLADLLCENAQMDRVFFGNSGAEANEAAIKLARLYGHQAGNRQSTNRGDATRFPWSHHGDPERHRQSQGAGRFRTAGIGLRARTLQRYRCDQRGCRE
jgi:acetylornithine/succinyldiaminopimelate/putrescine aminotransferase